MKIQYLALCILLTAQLALAADKCYLGIKRMKYQTDDCTGEGEIDKEYTQSEIETFNQCLSDGSGQWKQEQCDERGMYKVTFWNSDCKDVKERKLEAQWGSCEGKKMWTAAVHFKAALVSLALAVTTYGV